jgi:pimeloyl-ACP methyl ester carboxylesterase
METVQSADGTTIAYERAGQGQPLIIATGAFCDRHTSDGLVPLLAPHVTVVTYDRRGRGDSGDTQPYAAEREVEDVAALIDTLGGPVFLYGHSSGAIIALEAAMAGLDIAKLVVYEPPYPIGRKVPEDLVERVRAAVGEGRRGDAATLFLVEAVGVPAEMVGGISQSPDWPGMQAIAHTLPYDLILSEEPMPTERLRSIAMPTLSVCGSLSSDFLQRSAAAVAETIPDAKLLTLEGHGHGAPPEVCAAMLLDYLLK